ncbi:MAG: HAD hydrolase, family IA, variant 3 [candidate division TM6 bacterium GW2011_GWE2_42_60]|nr:MAG: HAD hydrolase, family IA, variant 3 [candidate division TM6 bacterium GW2011_GWE2_42_60]HBY05970.1 hypothetical protein [Candidatus Dependentiae bacterium]
MKQHTPPFSPPFSPPYLPLFLKKLFKNYWRSLSLACLLIVGCAQQSEAAILVFDFGGVLGKMPQTSMAIKELGLGRLLTYTLFGLKNPAHLKELMFKVLVDLYGEQQEDAGYPCACDGNTKLPAVLCDWLAGRVLGSEIIEQTNQCIDKGECDHLLSSRQEKRLIKEIVRIAFDPEIHGKYMRPLKETAALIKEIAIEHPEHTLMILSNYDLPGFQAIYNNPLMQKELFCYFKPHNIIISGTTGLLKPDPCIFTQELIQDYSLEDAIKRHEVFFIDDQKENIAVAEQCGIQGILFTTCAALRGKCNTFGII